MALLPIKHCLLIGAHSVGKTTLAKYLVKKLNCDISSEVARDIMKKMNIKDGEQIKTNKIVCFNLQKEIIRKLASIERDGKFENKFVIYDRSAIDALVYAKYFLTDSQYDELLNMNETKYLIEKYKVNSSVFLIQPCEKYLMSDNVRIMPSSLNEWDQFSKLFEQILFDLKINYFIIDKVELDDRFIQVMEKISF
jgi:nicotinamide riboside kinase